MSLSLGLFLLPAPGSLFGATSTTAAKTSSSSSFSFLIIIVLIFAGYYFVIRPQRARQRQQVQVTRQFDIGDEVVTTGGMIGRVRRMNDDRITLEISAGTTIEVLRSGIARRLEPFPSGEYESPSDTDPLDAPPSSAGGTSEDPPYPPSEGTT